VRIEGENNERGGLKARRDLHEDSEPSKQTELSVMFTPRRGEEGLYEE
jgi:hypothetical protein